MRVRSPEGGDRPYEIEIEHPLTGDCAARVPVSSGAIATSGLNSRIWTRANGSGFAHHLIDPSTGEPAWTGVISATALAPTALAAETLAKVAVLLGPAGARRVLRPGGGVIVLDDGTAELVGAVLRPPLLRVRVPARGEVAA
jgi:thiamine biosynthesis lipoprotein